MYQILLNGVAQTTSCQTVLELLESQGLTQGRFAVEIDGALVPKTRLGQTAIADNMVIEVVQAVGGG